MATYTKLQQWKKEKSERPRGELIKFIPLLDLTDGKLQDSGKREGSKEFHKSHIIYTEHLRYIKMNFYDMEDDFHYYNHHNYRRHSCHPYVIFVSG